MEHNKKTSRHQSREQAFFILFEKSFSDDDIEEIIENARLTRELFPSEFALQIVHGVCNNSDRIDDIIIKNLKGWKLSRISKVAHTLMRIAIYEMLYISDIPVSVSVNEAVELAKEYASQKDAAFINGVLGSASRSGICEEAKQ